MRPLVMDSSGRLRVWTRTRRVLSWRAEAHVQAKVSITFHLRQALWLLRRQLRERWGW
jgi:hypothetical protein